MKISNACACAVLLFSSVALARGKDFEEGVSTDEAARLVKSLSQLQARYTQAAPAMEKLKKDPDVFKTQPLTQAATEVLKSHATIGAFLGQIETGLKKRDSRVNAFEIELKSEIELFARRLNTLKDRAKTAQVPTLREVATAALHIAAELDTHYTIFDANYLAAIADVDLLTIPTVDVYAAVKFQSPFVAPLDGDEAGRWDTARAE